MMGANASGPNSASDKNSNTVRNDGKPNEQGSTSTNPQSEEPVQVIKCTELPPGFNLKTCYRMFSNPKGLAMIINNRRFKTQAERVGSEIDGKNLNSLFSQMGYKVEIHDDLTAQQMNQAIAEFATRPEHGQCDSGTVIVLSHGKTGKIYGTDEELVDIEGFVDQLSRAKCPGLADKPKMFILDVAGSYSKIQQDVDMVVAYPTGNVSYRDEKHGSFFIETICDVFAKNAYKEDIVSLWTMVENEMYKRFGRL